MKVKDLIEKCINKDIEVVIYDSIYNVLDTFIVDNSLYKNSIFKDYQVLSFEFASYTFANDTLEIMIGKEM